MTNDDLSSELQILLCCARTELDAGAVERLAALLAQPLDWPGLLTLANRHGVMPLLYRALSQHGAARVPPDVLAELRAQYQANARRNVVLTRELLRLLALLEQYGIPAIPYKGPALAMAAYGDLALRQFGDLDILVRPEDASQAKALLEAEGYCFSGGLTPAQTAIYAASANHHHFAMQRPAGQITVELHWRAAPFIFAPAVGSSDLWPQPPTLVLAGAEVLTSSIADTLLLLAMHGGKHGWERLGYVVDLAEFLRRQAGRFDPAELLTRAGRTRQTRRLRLGLWLAHQLLAAPLPEPLRADMGLDPGLAQLTAITLANLWSATPWPAGSLARLRYKQRLFDRRRDGWRYVIGAATAPALPDWQRWSLPIRFNFLYRLLRPLRLVEQRLRSFSR